MWIDELGWLDSILYDENSESLLICLRAPKEEGQGLSQGSVEGQQSRNWGQNARPDLDASLGLVTADQVGSLIREMQEALLAELGNGLDDL